MKQPRSLEEMVLAAIAVSVGSSAKTSFQPGKVTQLTPSCRLTQHADSFDILFFEERPRKVTGPAVKLTLTRMRLLTTSMTEIGRQFLPEVKVNGEMTSEEEVVVVLRYMRIVRELILRLEALEFLGTFP